MSMGALLEVRGISKRFRGLQAVDNVSFAVPRGGIVALIGPNGAGKTTTFNLIAGVFAPDRGSVVLDGADITGLRADQACRVGIARTFQVVKPFGALTVLENVMVGASCHARTGFWGALAGLPPADADERMLARRAMAALDRVGAADLAGQLPGSLAYGLRKRVALARALVATPRLLLLDEPAGGLSEAELPELGSLIGDLARDTTVVVIEHRMDLMMSVCAHIVVLNFGKVIAAGAPQQIQANPAVTAAYLGTGPGERHG
jgi:branched-chain amino acid transport system ATP-binding protein